MKLRISSGGGRTDTRGGCSGGVGGGGDGGCSGGVGGSSGGVGVIILTSGELICSS